MSSPPLGLPEFAGRYQLGRVVGTGGFAVVVRAYDEGLAAEVAVKILDSRRSLDPEIRERFIREARLLRRVRSPSLIGVHDVGETDDGMPYFVMDLATGTLEDRLDRPVAGSEVARVVGTLAAGLGSLHAAGVIHRDVKPSNLLVLGPGEGRVDGALLAPSEDLVLGDLGLAKDQQASSYGPTMLGGTPLYRAPEQMELGAPVDQRTDVYAASAVLWRLVTGADPPPPEQLEVQLLGAPEPWRSMLARGMALRPDDRFGSMSEWAGAVTALLGTEAPASSGVKAAATGATCPYKGLASFQASDAALFFGRSRLVDELVSRLQAHRALVIGGASGSGKSSLLRAGLLAALASGGLPGSQNWRQCLMVPGPHPLESLREKLQSSEGPVVVAIDQFEEAFTVCGDPAERRAFFEELAMLTRGEPPRARVVIALRADFYGACAADPWLAEAINSNQLLVGPMTRSQLREAVEGPARRVGLRLEEGLVDRILDDTGDDSGALPLLSHALVETWVRRRGGTLTVEGYEAAGGVAGAIGRSAEELWSKLDSSERTAARRVFLRLVRPGEAGRPDTKKGATRTELGEDEVTGRVIAMLAGARLVTVGDRGVELAHEALLRAWGRLAAWLDESRESLRTGERIEAAARDWEGQSRSPDALYRGSQLAAALEWRQSLEDRAPEPAASFLQAAEQAQQAEERARATQAHRRATTRRRVMAALSALAALALVTSIVALAALGRSRRDAGAAEEQLARNLAASALQQASADPYLATVLATEALARVDPSLPEAQEALVAARVALEGSRPVPYGDPIRVGDALTIALDPKGELAVTGQRNGQLALWDLGRRREAGRTGGPKGGIQKVAIAPDGSWAVAGGDDGTLWRWNLSGDIGKAEPLGDLGSILWSVAVSPDGRSVAAASEAGEVWLVDAGTGAPLGEPVGRNTGGFTSVAFAPDGQTLLAGDGTGLVQAWSLPSRRPRFAPIQAHTSDVWEIVVDPRNSRFLSVSSDGKSRLWDLATGARVQGGPQDVSPGAPEGLLGATFGPAGELVMGGVDGKLYSWSIDERRILDVTGTGHAARITDGARSAAATRLVTLAADQTVRVWDQSARPGPIVRVAGLDKPLYSIAVAGGRVAVGTGQGEAVVIDAVSGKIEHTLGGHKGRVFAMTPADDGRLVTGDQQGALRLWDLKTGRLVKTVGNAHAGSVNGLARSADGVVASAGADGVAKLWSGGLELRVTAEKSSAPLTDVAISAEGVAGTTSSGSVVRWDLDGKPVGKPVKAAGGALWAVDLDARGDEMALAGDDEVVSIWSVATPKKRLDLAPHRGGALDVAFLGRNTLAASSRTGEVRLWDVAQGRALGVLSIDEGSPVWHLAAEPDGSVWAAGEKGTVVRIDALVPARACALAAGSFDDAQKNRLLGGEELRGCSSVGTGR